MRAMASTTPFDTCCLDYDNFGVWDGGNDWECSVAREGSRDQHPRDFIIDAENEDILSFQRDCEVQLRSRRPSTAYMHLFKQPSAALHDCTFSDIDRPGPLTTTAPGAFSWDDPWCTSFDTVPMKRETECFEYLAQSVCKLEPETPASTCSELAGAEVPDCQPTSPATSGDSPGNWEISQYGVVPQLPAGSCLEPLTPTVAPPLRLLASAQDDGEFERHRQECLKRYRDKKARRMYTKMVRYQLRKVNADNRPRIKGRFIKKVEQDQMEADGLGSTSNGSPTDQT